MTWTAADLDELCRVLAEPITLSRVAARLGRSTGAIAGQVARLRMEGDPRLPAKWRELQRRGVTGMRVEATIADAPAPVDRDPCWRCGVRADIGCAHQVAPWSAAA